MRVTNLEPRPKPTKKFATLSDYNSGGGPAVDDSEDEAEKNLFTGGEKSALAVKPNRKDSPSTGNKLVHDIIERAKEGRRHPEDTDDEDDEPQAPQFSGTGYRLGTDQVPSQVVRDPNGNVPSRLPRVTRTMTFWRDGFTVEDSDLYRYDDPANTPYLTGIRQGTAPIQLLRVQPGQGVDVHFERRIDEDYTPPKRKPGGFHGQGQRLGTPVPVDQVQSGSAATSGAPTPAQAATPEPAAGASTSSLPAETGNALVQVQLADGSRHRRRFEGTGPVQQLYDFVAHLQPGQTREYVLQTTFPMKKLDDKTQTLKEAGVVGAVVVQRWA